VKVGDLVEMRQRNLSRDKSSSSPGIVVEFIDNKKETDNILYHEDDPRVRILWSDVGIWVEKSIDLEVISESR